MRVFGGVLSKCCEKWDGGLWPAHLHACGPCRHPAHIHMSFSLSRRLMRLMHCVREVRRVMLEFFACPTLTGQDQAVDLDHKRPATIETPARMAGIQCIAGGGKLRARLSNCHHTVHDDIPDSCAASDHVGVVPEQITRDQHTLGPCSSRQGFDTHVIAFYGCIVMNARFLGQPVATDRACRPAEVLQVRLKHKAYVIHRDQLL